MAKADLTAARLRELLHYDPETGQFTRRLRTAQRHQVGSRADFLVTGGNLVGYYRVAVDSERYLAHRAAWLYTHGQWPTFDIDHIDGDPGNNRIANLREAPRRINVENMRKSHRDSSTGLLGCHLHTPGRWRARIQCAGKIKDLGLFDTPEAAHAAYLEAKRKYHEGCTI